MFMTEVETFVKKFHQLWNDGVTAHLDLDLVPCPLHRPVHPFHQEVRERKVLPDSDDVHDEQLQDRHMLKEHLMQKL